MASYFQNLAALEHNMNHFYRHQRMIEEMLELLKKQEKLNKLNINWLGYEKGEPSLSLFHQKNF